MLDIILISGKAGVGKTTSANYLKSKFHKSFITPIATGVKEVAEEFGWDGSKDTGLGGGRKLLQSIGKIGREYNEDIWVEKAYYTIDTLYGDYPNMTSLIDDWRFPNEYAFLSKQYNLPLFHRIIKVRIEAENREMLVGTPEYDDISEVSLPSSPLFLAEPIKYYDYIIDNTKTFDDLYLQLDKLIGELK